MAKSDRCPACHRPQFRRHGLTPAQWRVADMAYLGKSRKEIASALNVSEKTVKFHMYKIHKILGTHSPSQLILKLIELKKLA
jgi:DNA-binding CsgD family transcriptional regulator